VILRIYGLASVIQTLLYLLVMLGFWYAVGYGVELVARSARRMLSATSAASASSR
jgi:hypothetical protein